MENYSKGKNVEEPYVRERLPFNNLPDKYLWMQVRGGSKLAGLIVHASNVIANKEVSVVVWSGAGVAVSKAITGAELIKRQFRIPHQVTKITYKTDEEFWDPKVEGLERLVVTRQIPVIHILLSTAQDFDINQIGYQAFEGKKFWQVNVTDADFNAKKDAAASKTKPKKQHTSKGNKRRQTTPQTQ